MVFDEFLPKFNLTKSRKLKTMQKEKWKRPLDDRLLFFERLGPAKNFKVKKYQKNAFAHRKRIVKTAHKILHLYQVCGFEIDQMWLSIVLMRLNTYTPDLKWENRILKIVSENIFWTKNHISFPIKWNSAQIKKSLLFEKSENLFYVQRIE